jgi:lipopolysaccharide transport system ATP-binding protein
MGAIKSLCNSAIILEKGQLMYNGETDIATARYLNTGTSNSDNDDLVAFIENQKDDVFLLKKVMVFQDESLSNSVFYSNKEVFISIEYEVLNSVLGLRVGFDLVDLASGAIIFRSFEDDVVLVAETIPAGNYRVNTSIPKNFLKNGLYAIKLAIGIHNVRWIVFDDKLKVRFSITNISGLNSAFLDKRPGFILPHLLWNKSKK